MKTALVHEWLTNMAGSERVVSNFLQVYPEAPLYTTVYNPGKLDKEFQDAKVHTSFLQKLPGARAHHQRYFPFMPMAFESFDLNEWDVVLSSSHSCAKGVITKPDTVHICYCHSPMRYGWEFYYEYLEREKMGWAKKKLVKYLMNYMRVWDVASANRVDYFIANSRNVARRIYKHYRREADVIYPPVRTSLFQVSEKIEDYYLMVSRLVPYKRIDLAVEAFNELGLPLVIIGDGPQRSSLEKQAGKNIIFMGYQPDEIIRDYYSRCRAFVFPGEEDFGITPLEAQASGRPVIAYGRGGALETVVDEATGVFFEEQTSQSLMEAVKRADRMQFKPKEIRAHAVEFDESIFREKIKRYVEEKYREHQWRIFNAGAIYSGNPQPERKWKIVG